MKGYSSMCLVRLLTEVIVVTTLLPIVAGHDEYSKTFKIVKDGNGCTTLVHNFDPLTHKPKYRVGVFSSEGDEVVYNNYNLTFSKYLTATAGKKFDPPIEFELLPVTLTSLMNAAEEESVDFFFASSAVSSCMATEHKAQPLVTVITRRESQGREYDLDLYGGVMFTLADNDEVNGIEDFKDRTIGAGGITMMGGGQTQFYEMVRHGLSYVADPKQVVFTFEEQKTVQGVLDGEFEIGFARTDQIERHGDLTGVDIPEDTFKIINPQTHKLDDGTLFPFVSSTGLHPEWPVAALDHVSTVVSREVQEALMALRDHAEAAEHNNTGDTLRCDTTPALARLALEAKTRGMLTGFRTARSYFEVRTKQETAGLLRMDDDGMLHCIRGETLYNDIECPDHHYKITEEEFQTSCERMGLPCKEGFECYCKPCVKAFEVDVFQYFGDDDSYGTTNGTAAHADAAEINGCEKMSLCGNIEQTKEITFRAVDNVQRKDAIVEVWLHLDHQSKQLDVFEVPDEPSTYEFHYSQGAVGVGILEIFFNGAQIPESPIRVQVEERRCDLDFPGTGKVAAQDGNCVCSESTVHVGSKCVDNKIFAIFGSIAGFLIVFAVSYVYVRRRSRKNDEMWQVNVDELHFDDPVEVIGQGSFGVVLLAEYRGTKVAIKRAIKSSSKTTRSKSGSGRSNNNNDHSGSIGAVVTTNDTVDSDNSPPEAPADVENPLPATSASTPGDIIATAVLEGGFSRRSSDGISFLADFFGGKRKKWVAKLFPWMKHYDYQSRFKESILGGSASLSRTTLTSRLCPCLSKQARRREEFMAEMRVLSRLRHPCITTVMGAVVPDSHDPMLVMEYMENGSLHDLLRNQTLYLNGEIIMQISRDIAQGLRYLHSSKPPILHGDLKARNILVDARFRAKICDFGLSTKRGRSITGTPLWLAPEYLRGESPYDSACDVYSMGIIFFEIYARHNPYKGEDFQEVLRKVCNRRVNKRPTIPPTTPPKFSALMKKCWSPDVQLRPQAKDLDMTLMDMNVQDAEPLAEAHQQGGRKKEITKDMLYELFPKHIADALKAGEKVEPEQHDLVTVIFSDIVGFTNISKEISPLKVSDMLDRLYLAFDKCAKKHDVFKVETIGDAYMGVTNLDNNHEASHVRQAAEFAISMINEASNILIDEEQPGMGYINIRCGFHSGAVVSNVIGSLNPRYGLFGDTVNTANRMESNSEANRILCSQRSYRLLKEQAPLIPIKKHGKINVKGKGEMYVFWVGDGLIDTAQKGDHHGDQLSAILKGASLKSLDDGLIAKSLKSIEDNGLMAKEKISLKSLDDGLIASKEKSSSLDEPPPESVPVKTLTDDTAEKLLEQRILQRLVGDAASMGHRAVAFADPV